MATFGDSIDWFVTEPLDTAHDYDTGEPVTTAVLDETLPSRGNTTRVDLPVHRAQLHSRSIFVSDPTLRTVLEAIAAFYTSPITDLLEIRRMERDPWGYRERVIGRLLDGESACWADMVGSKDLVCEPPEGCRRHPLFCQGLVRFEGLRRKRAGTYELVLGS
jgi:hypothetical protein